MAIYMKYGSVKGEVKVPGYVDWIDIKSFQWGVGRAISSAQAGSVSEREKSAASVSEIVLTKSLDNSSVKFLEEALQGQLDQDVKIHFTRTDKQQGHQAFLEYLLKKCGPSSYSISSGGEGPMESVALNFTNIEMKYYETKDDIQQGTPTTTTYDLMQGKLV
jgi:type VI secretion system secreted protein Hcp